MEMLTQPQGNWQHKDQKSAMQPLLQPYTTVNTQKVYFFDYQLPVIMYAIDPAKARLLLFMYVGVWLRNDRFCVLHSKPKWVCTHSFKGVNTVTWPGLLTERFSTPTKNNSLHAIYSRWTIFRPLSTFRPTPLVYSRWRVFCPLSTLTPPLCGSLHWEHLLTPSPFPHFYR